MERGLCPPSDLNLEIDLLSATLTDLLSLMQRMKTGLLHPIDPEKKHCDSLSHTSERQCSEVLMSTL